MKNRKLYIFAILPFVLGLIFGSIYDLQINQALYLDPKENVFGLVFSAFMPILSYGFFAIMAGIALYFFTSEKNKKLYKVLYLAVAIIFYGCVVFFTQDKIFSPNAFGIFDGAEKYTWAGYLGCALLEGCLVALGFLYGKQNNNKSLFYAGLILSVGILISLVPFAQILKNTMRRPRYRSTINLGMPFKNWWESYKSEYDALGNKNLSEEFKSFPSGHTGEAACLIFGLPYLGKLEPRLKNKQILCFVLGMVFALVMAFSRLTMGAHYLSDVSMGGLITALLSIAANEINIKLHLFDEKEEVKEPEPVEAQQ